MTFVLITGPMKSGKSLELIARVEPFKFAQKKIAYIQPRRNVRESSISSRAGVDAEALVVDSLGDVSDTFDVLGVDEVHMFEEADVAVIEQWVRAGKDVFISGLDLDYQGHMMPMVKRLFEYRPDTVIMKNSVCEVCHAYDARFTQILNGEGPVRVGLPSVVPDDGTYHYEARCRECFVRGE
ncbi:MAG: thymidine kinase [Patescibacteria group bacterium UBA2163]